MAGRAFEGSRMRVAGCKKNRVQKRTSRVLLRDWHVVASRHFAEPTALTHASIDTRRVAVLSSLASDQSESESKVIAVDVDTPMNAS